MSKNELGPTIHFIVALGLPTNVFQQSRPRTVACAIGTRLTRACLLNSLRASLGTWRCIMTTTSTILSMSGVLGISAVSGVVSPWARLPLGQSTDSEQSPPSCVYCLDVWHLALRHIWRVCHSIKIFSLKNLHCLLYCLNAGAWCCLTTVTMTICSTCWSSTKFCTAETQETVVTSPKGRPRSCHCTGPMRSSQPSGHLNHKRNTTARHR